jgi:hypothetical protein
MYPVIYTPKQKAIIRAHYPNMILQFLANGIVMGKKCQDRRAGRSYAFGVLYTREQAQAHLKTVEDRQNKRRSR